MPQQSYREKLLDPRWQKRRLEIFTRDKFSCCWCEDDAQTLHVHHKIYEYGKDPWEYHDDLLITLCESCHEEEEKNKKLFYNYLTVLLMGDWSYQQLANHLGGLLSNLPFDRDYRVELGNILTNNEDRLLAYQHLIENGQSIS